MADRIVQIPYRPRPQQAEVAAKVRNARFGVLVCHRRFGKCLDVDTPIATPVGYVPIGDIQAGDRVFGPDGLPTLVLAAHDVLVGLPCYRVQFSDGAEVICDSEHLWLTQTKLERTARDRTRSARELVGKNHGVRRETPGTVRQTDEIARTLRYQGESNHSVAVCEPLVYPDTELPINPYLLGAWLGDGHSGGAMLTSADEAIVDRFRAVYDVVPAKGQNSGLATTYLIRGTMGLALSALSVKRNKHIPESYLRAGLGQRLALLRGLMDTDGCINRQTGICEFTQKRPAVVHGFCDLLSSFGVKYTITTRTIKGAPYFRVMFTSPLQPFALARKADLWTQSRVDTKIRFLGKRYIVSAEPVESRPVRCLEVEHPSHLFLCSKWNIPTHNTILGVNLLQQGALMCQRQRPRFAYVGPTYRQGKATSWDYIQYYARPIPDVTFNQSELRADYPNGGQVRIFGADNPDTLRGIYLDGAVLDEFGMHPAKTFSEVIGPTLVDRGGWALFCGTPNGKNQFYDLAQYAQVQMIKGDPDWFYAEYKASETGLLDPAYLAQARQVMTEDEYQQEFECSFSASVKGAIYAKELDALRAAGRVLALPYDPLLPVDTDWDLGVGDSTAIWFSQSLRSGEVRLIDYYEASGEGLPHYAGVLQRKGYVYGQHWAPHDIQVRELGSGKSRLEIAATLGIKFQIVPQIGLEDGIGAARLLLAKCWFDAEKCQPGLESLGHYRRDYNQKLNEFKPTPVHDQHSHGADAFRGLAVRHRIPEQAKAERQRRAWMPSGPGAWMG